MNRALNALDGFWFAPESTSTLALIRISFGLLVLGWTLSLAPDLTAFFSGHGIVPHASYSAPGTWSAFGLLPGNDASTIVFIGLIVASLCLSAGLGTRVAAALVFVGVLSLERRDPFVFNSGDGLIRILAFYLMLAPSGSALSLDRLRRGRDRFWEFPRRAPWALRMMQLQLSILYLAAVWAKVRGTTWNDGTAISYAVRVGDLERLPIPYFVAHTATISDLLTYGALAIELGLAVLIWNRRLRPWVLGLGIALHLGIDWSIRVGFFSLAVLVLFLAFLPADRAERLILGLRLRPRPRLGLRPHPSA
jgi:hypothetical protein